MSRSADQIEKKKKELETSLSKIQSNLDRSMGEVRGDVAESLSPKEIVRKYPLPVLGASLLIGFLAGSTGRTKKRNYSSDTLADSIGSSLKKRLTRKAVDVALDYLEDRFTKQEKKSPTE